MKKFFLLILLIVSYLHSYGQFRMIGNANPGWTTVNDSTYTATVEFQSDETGKGYLATLIPSSGYRIFTGTEQVYKITSATSQTFSSALLIIVEYNGDHGDPVGQVLCYNPDDKETIPQLPFGSRGATAQMQAAIDAYNVRIGAFQQLRELTTAERDQLNSVTYNGALIRNKDTGEIEVNKNGVWEEISGQDSTRLLQDSILVYYQDGLEVGRDTLSTTGGSADGNILNSSLNQTADQSHSLNTFNQIFQDNTSNPLFELRGGSQNVMFNWEFGTNPGLINIQGKTNIATSAWLAAVNNSGTGIANFYDDGSFALGNASQRFFYSKSLNSIHIGRTDTPTGANIFAGGGNTSITNPSSFTWGSNVSGTGGNRTFSLGLNLSYGTGNNNSFYIGSSITNSVANRNSQYGFGSLINFNSINQYGFGLSLSVNNSEAVNIGVGQSQSIDAVNFRGESQSNGSVNLFAKSRYASVRLINATDIFGATANRTAPPSPVIIGNEAHDLAGDTLFQILQLKNLKIVSTHAQADALSTLPDDGVYMLNNSRGLYIKNGQSEPTSLSSENAIEINQVAHGFSEGDFVYWNGSAYANSTGLTNTTMRADGIVDTVYNVDNFVFRVSGITNKTFSLSEGLYYATTTGPSTIPDLSAAPILRVQNGRSIVNPPLQFLDNDSGNASGTTDGSGDLTINHNLGVTPDVITATSEGIVPYMLAVHTKSATDFKVRVFNSSGVAQAATPMIINYRASQ